MTDKKFEIIRNPDAPKRKIGYARVSTAEQSLEMQTDALARAGVLADDMHVEKVSAAASKRPRLEEAIASLRPGDTFVVWKLDRLARSLQDLLRRLEQISTAGAEFKSVTDAIDTTTATGRLVMHLLGSIAEFERDLIRERTKAGMRAASERGMRPGQPEKLDGKQKAEAQRMRDKGISARSIAKKFKVSVPTIYNHTVGPGRSRTGNAKKT